MKAEGKTVKSKAAKPAFDNFNVKHFDLYSENQEIISRSKEKVRKMLEKVPSCPSFFIFAGSAGGTGSGMGSRMLVELKDDF